MIPFLRNYWAKLATLEIKGRRTKKYDDIKSFLGVNITRDDSSKQERKKPSKLTIRDSNFWENENSMKKRELHVEKGTPWRKGTYISQVSIHAYWSWYIAFILDIVSHHHLHFWAGFQALIILIVGFLALSTSIFKWAFEPSHLR
jgi:hypothetical protein